MTQITRTSNELILKALRLINIAPPDLGVDERKLTEGLETLNMLLDEFQSSGIYIPFRNELTFAMTPAQGTYYFGYSPFDGVVSPDLILQLDYCFINDSGTKYKVNIVDVSEYNNADLISRSNSLPFLVFMQRNNEYTDLRFINVPDKAYSCTITAKFALTHVVKNEALDKLPAFSHRFLMYAVARELQSIYRSGSWSNKEEQSYQSMYTKYLNSVDIDLVSRASNPFTYCYDSGYIYGRY